MHLVTLPNTLRSRIKDKSVVVFVSVCLSLVKSELGSCEGFRIVDLTVEQDDYELCAYSDKSILSLGVRTSFLICGS